LKAAERGLSLPELQFCQACCYLLQTQRSDCSDWERQTALDRAANCLQAAITANPDRYGSFATAHQLFEPVKPDANGRIKPLKGSSVS
jgi:hypothetical protein